MSPITLGRFTLIREIGRGGMGVVYEAWQQDLDCVVAVKVLHSGTESAVAVARFLREAKVLAKLRHPHIAQPIEAGTAKWNGRDVPFYAMEYIAGGRTLNNYVRDCELTTRQRLALLIDLCSAVHHGHTRGVLHRDLKPANVLIDSDGRLKLIDFGVARVLADIDNPLRTSGDSVIGTVQYMSPEQISGDAHSINPQSDLYSLGVMCWEVLAGVLPYDTSHRTLFQAADVIRTQSPPPLRTGDPTLDAPLDAVLRRAMEKRREDRYATVAEFMSDLERACNGRETVAASYPRLDEAEKSLWQRLLLNQRARVASCIVLGGLCGFFSAHPAIISLPPASKAQQLMSRLATERRNQPMSSHLMVVGIEDTPAVSDLAAELRIDGFDLAHEGLASMRRVHGRLIARLAEARASVICLDLVFKDQSTADPAMVKGLVRARELGVPVTAGMEKWDASTLSPEIAANVTQLGGVTAQLNKDAGAWAIDVAAKPVSRPWIPSLALVSAVAKLERNFHRMDVVVMPGGSQIEVLLYESAEGEPEGRLWREQTWRFEVQGTQVLHEDGPNAGLSAGSLLAQFFVDLPGRAEHERAYLSLADALRMPAEELTKRVIGKVVVVGDFRTSSEKRHTTPEGLQLPDAYAQIMAIDALLGTQPTRPAGVALIGLAVFGAASMGGLIVMRYASGLRRILAASGGLVFCVACCVLLLVTSAIQLNPVPVVVAFLTAVTALSVAQAAFLRRLVPLNRRHRSIHSLEMPR